VNSAWLDVVVAIACLIGITGTIIPILPGTFLVAGAVAVAGAVQGGSWGWGLAIAAVALTALATGLKFLVPARWMREGGVPTWILVVGAIAGIAGFFLIPIVGLFIGFIVGVFGAEAIRVRNLTQAWPTTVTAMKAAGLSTLIDFSCAVLVTAMWVAVTFAIN
jgi:uncharacterized protein YqgC (DUF456 family)